MAAQEDKGSTSRRARSGRGLDHDDQGTSLATSPPPPPLDPAASAMVLRGLQNLSLPGNASFNPSPYGDHSYGPTAPMLNGDSATSPTANIDFNAILASLGSGAAQFQDQSQYSQHQPPAYVSASQLHPYMDTSAAAGPSSSSSNTMTTGNVNSAAGSSASGVAAKKKAVNNGKAKSTTPRASSPSEENTGASSSSAKRVPPFLNKLRNMIDDEATNELICWQPEGKTFLVPNNIRFAKEVLPRFFKHNNFSSFVRQLNMYGFHKVPSLQQGSLKHEQEMEVWEFENDNFVRDQPELMINVQRKPGHKGDGAGGERGEAKDDKEEEEDRNKALVDSKAEGGLNAVSGALTRIGDSETRQELSKVWHAIQTIRSTQEGINDNLRHLSLHNETLWQKAMESERRAEQQSETINRMLRFLAGIYANQDVLGGKHEPGTPSKGRKRGGQGGSGVGPGRGLFRSNSSHPLMIQGPDAASSSDLFDQRHDTPDDIEDNSERFHELFTRISETGSNENTPRESRSPTEPGSPSKFTTLRSPTPTEGSAQPRSGSSRPVRPSLSDAGRRPSTPSGSRSGSLAPQQILSALQQMFAGSGGEGGASLPGTPYAGRSGTPFSARGGTPGPAGAPTPSKKDPNLIASLQSVIAMMQAQQNSGEGGSGSGTNEGALGIYNADDQQNDSNRFIYPYTGGPTGFTPPSSNSPVPSHASPNYGGGNQLTQMTPDNPFAQYLQGTEADAASVQKAIGALVEAFRVPGSGSRGSTPGPSSSNTGAGSSFGQRNSDGFANGGIAPGNWNQYASSAGSTSQRHGSVDATGKKGGPKTPAGNSTSDIDVDALLSQFIDSSAAGSTGPDDEGATTPTPTGAETSQAGAAGAAAAQAKQDSSSTSSPALESTSGPSSPSAVAHATRQKRKSLDAQGDVDMQSAEADGDAGGQKRKKTNHDTRGGGGGGGRSASGAGKFGQTSVEDG